MTKSVFFNFLGICMAYGKLFFNHVYRLLANFSLRQIFSELRLRCAQKRLQFFMWSVPYSWPILTRTRMPYTFQRKYPISSCKYNSKLHSDGQMWPPYKFPFSLCKELYKVICESAITDLNVTYKNRQTCHHLSEPCNCMQLIYINFIPN
jgi:hypothetical protein